MNTGIDKIFINASDNIIINVDYQIRCKGNDKGRAIQKANRLPPPPPPYKNINITTPPPPTTTIQKAKKIWMCLL